MQTDLICNRCNSPARVERLVEGEAIYCTGCHAIETNGVGNAISKGFSPNKMEENANDISVPQDNSLETLLTEKKRDQGGEKEDAGNVNTRGALCQSSRDGRKYQKHPTAGSSPAPDPLQSEPHAPASGPQMAPKLSPSTETSPPDTARVDEAEDTAEALRPLLPIPPGLYHHRHNQSGPWWITYNQDGKRYRQSTGTRDLKKATELLNEIKRDIETAKITQAKKRACGTIKNAGITRKKRGNDMAKSRCQEEGCGRPKWKEQKCFRHWHAAHKAIDNAPGPAAVQPAAPPLQTLNMADVERAFIAVDGMTDTYQIRLDIPERALIFRVIYGAMQRQE